MSDRRTSERILAVTALLLAFGAVAAGWAIAGVVVLAVALSALTLAGRRPPDPFLRTTIELARCRRQERSARLMVASLDRHTSGRRRRRIASELARSLRITDGTSLLNGRGGPLLCAVFSGSGFEGERVERRLRSVHPRLSFGWATFPDDGVTLGALLEIAAGRSERAASRGRAPAAWEPFGVGAAQPSFVGRRTQLGVQASSASSLRKEG